MSYKVYCAGKIRENCWRHDLFDFQAFNGHHALSKISCPQYASYMKELQKFIKHPNYSGKPHEYLPTLLYNAWGDSPGWKSVNSHTKITGLRNDYKYCGPFFIKRTKLDSNEEFCSFHGDTSHGIGIDNCDNFKVKDCCNFEVCYKRLSLEEPWQCESYFHGGCEESESGKIYSRDDVSQFCLDLIDFSNVVFAWIDSEDIYGTLAEIGYARAKGKYICIGFNKEFEELWFAKSLANSTAYTSNHIEAFNIMDMFLSEMEEENVKEKILSLCESPIELKLCRALCELLSFEKYIIEPQNKILNNKYRVDFLITPKNIGKGPLIVECDGHDYHERTKEQAQRDKQRDRECVLAGYTVLRFTGSEIHNNVEGCIKDILAYLGEE